MVYVQDPNLYINADLIRDYGVIVDTVLRTHPLLIHNKHTATREVRAFTIGDVFRLVQWEAGETNRRPMHRILDEDKEVIIGCSFDSDLLADLNKAAMERFLAR
jgi:hypothetical protein